MKNFGYTHVPSLDNNCSNYSDFIDKMKDFLSKDSDISYANQLSDFCDKLKERLNTYGINQQIK